MKERDCRKSTRVPSAGALAAWACLAVLVLACATRAEPGSRPALPTSERLAVDGAELFLQVRGAAPSAPILLWLHGGPGGAQRPLFRHFQGELEERFVVAYWDQRGAGRSFAPEADPDELTVARHVADLDVVVDHLRRRFGREQVVLIGHSWGSALGLLYARDHGGKVAALLCVAPLVSARASQGAAHAFVREEATRRGDEGALTRLGEIGAPPFQTAAQVLALERLTERFGGVFHRPPKRPWLVLRGTLGGLVTPWEIARLIRANRVSLDAMHEELSGLDLRRAVPAVKVPVVFLLGRHDRHVDARIAESYLEGLGAPEKRLIWFEHSAHNVPFEEPERFREIVIRELQSLGAL